ncbi:Meiotically up-regulated gene 137 protein [Neolecta irregularis DAH-3]|uniref:Meiotically up-regulated gene 137 protein n=1 Tax=Neolecta irregularis (strain DAH-3) TaxID=1198029 RepID=A0A1U7LNS2_NEOID|nr:Meiotically up-regulated gene 137 protein [Neolecta irregularis DAH-3]|eukprot:OLL24278.1 Meiotically up-regulated gene 137 protein [Neolecta irregularis DAH-3]
MAMRQAGMDRLFSSMQIYIKVISKKIEGDDREKTLPVDSLGQSMICHGEEFAQESAFGQTLLKLGVAEQKMSRIQSNLVTRTTDSTLNQIERSLIQMKDYQTAKKKLESRRLAYDAASNKTKNSKKEDAKLEEELRTAKTRFEETSEDVQNRMDQIQDSESDTLFALTDFMEAQLEYHTRCQSILQQLKNGWVEVPKDLGRGKTRSVHQAFTGARDDEDDDDTPRPVIHSKLLAQDPSDPLCLQQLNITPRVSRSTSAQNPSADSSRPQSSSAEPLLRRTATEPVLACSRPSGPKKFVKANFAFDAEANEELSLNVGDLIGVVDEVDPGWWIGEIVDNEGKPTVPAKQGLFPANYCTPVPQPFYRAMPKLPPRTVSDVFRDPESASPSASSKDSAFESSSPSVRRESPVRTSTNTLSKPAVSKAVKASPPPPPISRAKKSSVLATRVDVGTCGECGCSDYQKDFFKKGRCNNCFHEH